MNPGSSRIPNDDEDGDDQDSNDEDGNGNNEDGNGSNEPSSASDDKFYLGSFRDDIVVPSFEQDGGDCKDHDGNGDGNDHHEEYFDHLRHGYDEIVEHRLMIEERFNDDDTNSPNHPLFLHQNDHPGLILISKNTIDKQISNSLNFVNTACDLWKKLQEHYSQLDGHRVYQLTNDLVQLKQNNLAIEIYYHKLKGLWDEYDSLEAPYMCVYACVCENRRINGERGQRKRFIQFLMGLDECYANVRGQILLMNPMPTVAKAYSMIRQEEKQREGSTFKNIPTVLSAQSNYTRNSYNNNTRFDNSRFGRNYSQGKSSSRNSNQGESSRRSNFKKAVICGNCGKEGHVKEECYKIVGYPVGHPLHGKYKPSNQTLRNNSQDNNSTVNMTMSQGNSNESTVTTTSNDAAINARMD
ncbi:cysteine-rich receptor-like protein kinase 8 [Tanacetum coccineum]